MKLFKTFFIGGYECADMINNRGNRVDLLQETAHDSRIAEDYALLKEAGIKTVREGIRWSYVEKQPHQYDFSEVINRIRAAQEAGIQQLWDICHFGYPDNLMPSHPQFADRFAALCKAFTELYRRFSDDQLIVTPINEISFISWLGGDVRGTIPFAINSGFDVKYFLCRAAIKGIEAIKSVDPSAQIMMVEPLVRVHPIEGNEPCDFVKGFNEWQFHAMDMVTGRHCPELGGKPEYLDIAGFNYYYNNQWEHNGKTLCWKTERHRSVFPQVLKAAYERYNIPVVISETGHFGEDRELWMNTITEDCIEALQDGVDLRGICIYPVLDRPDWDMLDKYIDCGIWGYDNNRDRFTNESYLNTVKNCIALVDQYLKTSAAAKEKDLKISMFL